MKNLWLFERHRLEILKALVVCPKNLCGCDISQKLKMRKNLASYHLAKLIQKGLVRASKSGRNKHYSIVPNELQFVKKIIQVVEKK